MQGNVWQHPFSRARWASTTYGSSCIEGCRQEWMQKGYKQTRKI
jgi:hypothetical protein